MRGLSIAAVGLLVACTTPDVSNEIKAFAGAARVVSDDAAQLIQAEIEAERKRLRAESIADDRIFYLPPTKCQTGIIGDSFDLATAADYFTLNCELTYVIPEGSSIQTSEQAAALLNVLSEYVDTLISVAGSDLPAGIEAATGDLIASGNALANQVNGTASSGWLFSNAGGVAGLAGFAARQQKARILRRAVQDMQDPVRKSVDALVAYFINTKSDPLVGVLDNIQRTYDRMKRNPGNPALVTAYEKAIAAFPAARAKSPIIRFQQIQLTHDALVARLTGPASTDEILDLVKELNALKGLF